MGVDKGLSNSSVVEHKKDLPSDLPFIPTQQIPMKELTVPDELPAWTISPPEEPSFQTAEPDWYQLAPPTVEEESADWENLLESLLLE